MKKTWSSLELVWWWWCLFPTTSQLTNYKMSTWPWKESCRISSVTAMWNSASGQWKASSSGLTNDWEKECNCIRLYCFTQNMIKGASQVSIARWSLLSPPFPDGLSIRKISVLLTSTIYWLKNISARFVWSQVLLAMCFKPGIWDIFWMKWHLMCTKFSYIDSVNSDSFFFK